MNRTTLIAILVLIATSLYANTLERNKEVYRDGIAKIEANTAIKDKLDSVYMAGLDRLINTYKAKADFDAVKALMGEKTRFELEKTNGEEISYCKDLQTKYKEQLLQYEIGKITDKLNFSRRYLISLKRLLADLMKQNKMTEAEEVNIEIKSVNFIIADLTSQLPKEKPSHPKDAIQFGNHYYKVFQGKLTWQEADAKCKEMGGYLVCITSEMESNFIKSRFAYKNCWIGLYAENDKPHEWKWVDGSKVTYNDFHGHPHLGNFVRFGKHNNRWMWIPVPYDNDWAKAFICEWDK